MCTIFDVQMGNKKSLSDAISKVAIMLNSSIDIDISRDLSKIRSLIDYNNKSNSLAARFPDVAKQWHPTKNGNLKPESISASSTQVVWWLLLYDDEKTGKNFKLEWEASVRDRAIRGDGCPYLSGHKVLCGLNDLLTSNHDLAKEWNYDKNKGLLNKKGEDISTPDKVLPGSAQKVWWKCSNCYHEWQSRIDDRNRRGRGCPECYRNSRKRKTIDPSELEFDSNKQSA